MKKYFLIIIIGLSFSLAQAQATPEAMRYAQDNLNGTARFRAMSGAFGAVGGDFSSININPAGSAIFANNQAGFTMSSNNVKNNSDYFGTKTSENNNTFDINQAGFIFVFKNHNPKSGWKKISVGLNYENTNNFNNSAFSAGTNPNNSIANYFLSYANPNANQAGIQLSTLKNSFYEDLNYQDQQAFLGYQGFVINPVTTNLNNTTYFSNTVPQGQSGKYYQENSFASTGYNGKIAINLAAQYNHRFYFGMNLNSHFSDYRQSTSFNEENSNSQTSGLRSLRFDNDLYTYGSGFSFQLGAIAKITNDIRFGLAYESPTWYHLNDELRQTLLSSGSDFSNTSVDSNVTIVYAPYNLQTPGKYTGSFAYVFGKKGLISIDYTLKDYSQTKYKPTSEFNNVNQNMSNNLETTSELRIGAEYRIQKWSLRGGFRNEQSPYKDKQIQSDLNGFSAGFGYNFGFTKLDLAYSYAHRNSQQSFFSQGFTDGAAIKTENNNFSMTLLFEL